MDGSNMFQVGLPALGLWSCGSPHPGDEAGVRCLVPANGGALAPTHRARALGSVGALPLHLVGAVGAAVQAGAVGAVSRRRGRLGVERLLAALQGHPRRLPPSLPPRLYLSSMHVQSASEQVGALPWSARKPGSPGCHVSAAQAAMQAEMVAVTCCVAPAAAPAGCTRRRGLPGGRLHGTHTRRRAAHRSSLTCVRRGRSRGRPCSWGT